MRERYERLVREKLAEIRRVDAECEALNDDRLFAPPTDEEKRRMSW